MPGYVVERHGFLTASDLLASVITDMVANGFTQSFPSTPFNASTAASPYKVILEASGSVDPLNGGGVAEKQPWRICFDIQGPQRVFVYVATPLQLPNSGDVATEKVYGSAGLQSLDVIGNTGDQMGNYSSGSGGGASPAKISSAGVYSAPSSGSGAAPADEITKGLIMRQLRVTDAGGGSYPMSYRLVISPRGLWLGVWEDAVTQQTSSMFNWILVQRPVDRTTGTVLTTGKSPVFCVSAHGGQYFQFVVRESDILRPGLRRSASINEDDSEAIINAQTQVSLSEDGKYIVTFPSRLNTSRYRYPHELDMIGITSADVVSQFSDVPLTVYGEGAARSYKAMQANFFNNTGMRILVLQQGGGIS